MKLKEMYSLSMSLVSFVFWLYLRQNYAGMSAIITALSSTPVNRLKKTWTVPLSLSLFSFFSCSHVFFRKSPNRRPRKSNHWRRSFRVHTTSPRWENGGATLTLPPFPSLVYPTPLFSFCAYHVHALVVMLKDLIFIEDGNPTTTDSGGINFYKFRHFSQVPFLLLFVSFSIAWFLLVRLLKRWLPISHLATRL